MTKLRHRVEAFAERVRWLGPFMGGVVPAALYLAGARRDPSLRAEGRFSPFTFVFRGSDLSAVREVLLDCEYAFLRPVLHGLSAPVIIDAGAHIGLFSLWILSERPESRILSIEADPLTYAVLCENIARSKECVSCWRAVNRAAWGDGETVRFTDAGDAMSHRVSDAGTISVEGITLDELVDMVAPDGEIDLLKVDIEGAEEAFLCANPGTLTRIKNLVVELHPNLCEASRVETLLRSSFATVQAIGGRTSAKPLLLCRR
jgi:FkbM family methyltransferase